MIDKASLQKAGYLIGIGIGIVIVVAFVTGQILMPLMFGRPPKVEVPQVVGKNVSEAKRIMRGQTLHVVVTDSVWSETEKIETVLEQSPQAGELIKQEGTVYVVISKGSQVVSIPSVAGRPYMEAFVALRDNGLRAIVADSLFNESYPRNSVIRTSPPTGAKVERTAIIKMYISRGPEPLADSLRNKTPEASPYLY